MCVGENCAPQASHYMNAQLTALYENALACVRDHPNAGRVEDHFRYAHALADFSYGKRHTLFSAEFGKPRLEFICNHDALLYINVAKALYHVDHTAESAAVPNLHEIQNVEVAFRVSFIRKTISGKDSQVGSGQNIIPLIVFDLTKAKPISFTPAVTNGRDALVFYLTQYMDLLQRAGHHVLFSLPDFDDDRYRLTIDFSLNAAKTYGLDKVFNISVNDLNSHIKSMWLKAAMLAAEADTESVDWHLTSLAEFRSPFVLPTDSKAHFHISFGAPRVKVICPREAIVTYVIEEVTFYSSTDFKSAPLMKFNSWEVSVLVDVEYLTEADGAVTSFRLDMKSARLCLDLCTFDGFDEISASEDEYTCWSILIEFFRVEYTEILESANYHILYYHDERWVKIEEDTVDRGTWGEEVTIHGGSSSSSSSRTEICTWKEVLATSNMYSFHQIIAVSQASLVEHFNNLWLIARASKVVEEVSILSSWGYKETFTGSFKPMTLRLLSNGRALVWIHLDGGHLKSQGNNIEIDGCRLAFEVDLKMSAHSELKGVSQKWLTKYEASQAFKHHGKATDRTLRHIYLDFTHADFIHESSNVKMLLHERISKPVEKVKAVINHIKSHYFQALVENGLHILHTIPVWKANSAAPAYGLTSAVFHVYSQTTVTRTNWTQTVGGMEPIIVILGMTGHQRLPEVQLRFSSSWVIKANARLTYGTISIAKNIFVQERLLDQLARINAATTLVPVHFGFEDNTLNLEVEVWAKHEKRKNHPCNWQLVEGRTGYAQYMWQHRDIWSYEHEGNNHIQNGFYKISCLTKNFVEMPTLIKNKNLDIKVWGGVSLEMEFKSQTSEWSTKSSAAWDTLLAVVTEAGTLKIKEAGHVYPVIEKSQTDGLLNVSTSYQDPKTIIQGCLPKYIDFGDVVRELRAFEGVWQYSYPGTYGYALANPSFNKNGDIIFEARPAGLQVPVVNVPRQISLSGLRTPTRGSSWLHSPRALSRNASQGPSPTSPMVITPSGTANGVATIIEANGTVSNGGMISHVEEKVEKTSVTLIESNGSVAVTA